MGNSEQFLDARVEAWVAPAPGPLPTGVDCWRDPAFRSVEEEIGKIENPSGTPADWDAIIKHADELLTRTKDLRLVNRLTIALLEKEGLRGLAAGLELFVEIIGRYWDSMHPKERRRLRFSTWMFERIEIKLSGVTVAAAERDSFERVKTVFARVRSDALPRFGRKAPAVGNLHGLLRRLELSLPPPPKKEKPKPAGPVAAPPPHPDRSEESRGEGGEAPTGGSKESTPRVTRSEPEKPKETPAPPKQAPSTPPREIKFSPAEPPKAPETPGAVTAYLRRIGAELAKTAALLRRSSGADANAYRLLRVGLYLHMSAAPPATAGKTQVPAVPAKLKAKLDALSANSKWAALLEESESALLRYRFCLDLHHLSARALAGLGYEAALETLVANVAELIMRMPGLETYSASDGSPLADTGTRRWIEKQVRAPTAGGGSGGEAREAQATASSSTVDEIEALVTKGKVREALRLAASTARTAASGLQEYSVLLTVGELLARRQNCREVSLSVFQELLRIAESKELEYWDPDLVKRCLVGVLTARKPGTQPDNALFQRLCRLDPEAAFEITLQKR